MEKYGGILYIVAMIAIFYFIILRPQKQRQKQHQDTINELKPNVSVTTIGGMLGKVVKVKDNTIILNVADNVDLEVLKSAVAYINKEEKK